MPLDDQAAGSPYGTLSVPGRDIGLQLLLKRQADGTGIVLVAAVPGRRRRARRDAGRRGPLPARPCRARGGSGQGTDFSVGVLGFGEYTLLIAKDDPGQGIVWTAFASLITGIAITFYLPRRRIWARLSPAGDLAIVARSDRYVDVEREFGRLLDDLVAARRPA